MSIETILEDLNDKQRAAVTASLDHQLVLAGAGSGKTRVLVHRIAWLIHSQPLTPYNILAVTFTNKAAGEMRKRIASMIKTSTAGMWVGTFHGIAHRLLRTHWQDAGLPQAFQILDADDQYRIIRRISRQLGLDEAYWPPRKIQWFINECKDEGLRSTSMDVGNDAMRKQFLEVYQEYEASCNRSGLVDFAELLLRAYDLLRSKPEILTYYQGRFNHILVDEFQDTNTLQYEWIKLLAGDHGKVFIVGDDDQSIYGWRGAKVENISHFQRDFSTASLIKLEQNYRSTNTILSAANALIANNTSRLGKELWSDGGQGEMIDLYSAFNEQDEARYVVGRLQQCIAEGEAHSGIAILYRSNAQSRLFEEALMTASVKYRVYGGLRFFDRAEIKDVLAYMRLTQNRDDDAAFERIINTPTRGIGERTLSIIRDGALANRTTLWVAALEVLRQGGLSARAQNAVRQFVELLDQMEHLSKDLSLEAQAKTVIDASGLADYFAKDKSEKGQSRIENIEEMINAAGAFQKPEEDEDLSDVTSFLAHASLEAGEGQGGEGEECVQLMTLHSAKGLEFPVVFLVGMEQGLFPHSRSIEDLSGLEEERRLCYVGMTRARQKLYLSYAESRRLHGTSNIQKPSRFLDEIPKELIVDTRPKLKISQPGRRSGNYRSGGVQSSGVRSGRRQVRVDQESREIPLGQRVMHPKFGEGVVLGYEGDGSHTQVQVNFASSGTKRLVLAYAKLEMLS